MKPPMEMLLRAFPKRTPYYSQKKIGLQQRAEGLQRETIFEKGVDFYYRQTTLKARERKVTISLQSWKSNANKKM